MRDLVAAAVLAAVALALWGGSLLWRGCSRVDQATEQALEPDQPLERRGLEEALWRI